MRRMELTGLVATTDEEFIGTAVELAGNFSRRNELRAEIASRRKILFHNTEAVRALERCLVEAIDRSHGAAVVVS
jgi:predicted O-linked N-acetylglucosamine transferase (SPINDLY family)